ncbi:MAG: nucleoside-diphosphate kinase [Candidatus Cloacimonetes bacterium]|nr:nucleoside-diphosphate kinase [Candidatus Cloacimonadota bacterium]
MEINTLMLIKPDAASKNKIGEIIKMIEDNGFIIQKMKMLQMTDELAKNFYAVHKGKSFFKELLKFMTSDKIVAIVLKRENAVDELRLLVGATNSNEAKVGTIRYLYGTDIQCNAVHASDSVENAKKEISIIFP